MESMLGQHPDSLQGPDYVIQDSYPRTWHFCIKPLIEKFNSQASGAQDHILESRTPPTNLAILSYAAY